MKEKRINPLTVQSKQWLLDALLQLMNEKSYGEITIKELTGRAGLDRKTFYRHFRSKEELLELPLKEVFDQYVGRIADLSDMTSYEVVKAYFDLCRQYADYLTLLHRHGLIMIFLMKLSEYLPVLNDMFKDNPVYRSKTAWELTYEAGGIWNATVRWISTGARETPEEMAGIIGLIAPPLL